MPDFGKTHSRLPNILSPEIRNKVKSAGLLSQINNLTGGEIFQCVAISPNLSYEVCSFEFVNKLLLNKISWRTKTSGCN